MKAKAVIPLLMTATLFAVAAPVIAGDQEDAPFLLQFTHDASDAAGIGELAETSLPVGQQEVRIWFGFGIFRVSHMLRLQVKPSGDVLGELLVHYRNDLSDMDSKDAKEFRRGILDGCKDFREGKVEDVCTATFDHGPNWRSIYRELLKNGLLELPDESTLPEPAIEVSDGFAIVVELRDGPRYRAYEYSNPMFRSEPQAVSASKVMRIVGGIISDSNEPLL